MIEFGLFAMGATTGALFTACCYAIDAGRTLRRQLAEGSK